MSQALGRTKRAIILRLRMLGLLVCAYCHRGIGGDEHFRALIFKYEEIFVHESCARAANTSEGKVAICAECYKPVIGARVQLAPDVFVHEECLCCEKCGLAMAADEIMEGNLVLCDECKDEAEE